MTVPTTINRVSYSGSTATSLPYGFKIFEDEDLEVYKNGGLLALSTDYIVTGAGEQSGGNVVLTSTPQTTDAFTIIRKLPLTQEIDYQPLDPFPAESHEEGLDRGVMLVQQIQEELDRSVKLSVYTASTADLTLPEPSAGSAIGWNDSGDALTNDPSLSTINAAVASAQSAKTAAEAAQAAAELAETNAETAETNAEAAEAKAEDWAEETEDTEVEAGKYSAKHWAAKAEDYAASVGFDIQDVGMVSNAGGYVTLPGSGLTNGKPIMLTTSFQTIHEPNSPAGYCDYYEIWGQSVDGSTEVIISLSSGSSNVARVILEQENGPYLIMRGIADREGTPSYQAKADVDNDALVWIVVRQLPLAADSTSPGVVMPSGSATEGFDYLDTAGDVIHQGGAGSGYCDLVRMFAVSRGNPGVTVTVTDGTNTFISRELPANGWQEFLGEIALTGSDTLTGYASANSLSTMNTIIFRMPTS